VVPNKPPTITSFAPTSGPVGQRVTIIGTGFTGSTSVTFNGVAAAFTVLSPLQIVATVPLGATTGTISVTNPADTAMSAASFTVTPTKPPTISGFTPPSGEIGAKVTIQGSNFLGATSVTFNGVSANFTVVTNLQISATVPSGATSGQITVTNSAGSATSAASFKVIP
jgi:hypothetical protein